MKEIPLTQGKVTLVDDADFDDLAQFKWYARRDRATWYALRKTYQGKKQTTVLMHALIAGGLADHRNGNGLDNRRENLRRCTRQQNAANTQVSARSRSGFKGVSFVVPRRKRQVTYQAAMRNKYLGTFERVHDAARAYDRAAVEKYGEFACVNFPEDFPHLNLRCARRVA